MVSRPKKKDCFTSTTYRNKFMYQFWNTINFLNRKIQFDIVLKSRKK